jgi:hypothetical protein
MKTAVLRTFVGEAVRLRIGGEHYVGKLIAQGSEFYLAPIVGLNHLGEFAVTNGHYPPFASDDVAEIRRLPLTGTPRLSFAASLR